MNLFEKVFNHQILSRLEDSGTFMVTSHERAWLKTMLAHPAAQDAFLPETLSKLGGILEKDQVMDTTEHLLEKARSREKHVYHPLLRPLRQSILARKGLRLSYEGKSGYVNVDHLGVPLKLEYSMIKREWYLHWINLPRYTVMCTRVKKIHSATEAEVDPAEQERAALQLAQKLHARRRRVVIEIVPLYNEELSRILYAFSSFEKTVAYDAETDAYRVTVYLLGNEFEYLLSKLRFLGKRVRVVQGQYLINRMLESSTKALSRYAEADTVSEGTPITTTPPGSAAGGNRP
ncbi:WYL domain-containing protein [Gorillibacterium sp. CAU 1737]|uniref:WYL domain-containing protein n=1 Tax=Gorillibacterium sp. CAU 1737 TaxID=3140362 RepID=UPI0032613D3A